MKNLIAGNWKMNGTLDGARALIADIVNGLDAYDDVKKKCDILCCPPFLYIPAVRHSLHSVNYVSFGGQDCSAFDNGAHTGDVSAEMLKDSNCEYVIVGHSERRQYQDESDKTVQKKAEQTHKNNMCAIICVGELESQREAGQEQHVVREQILNSLPKASTPENTVVAYEPVWAIGTGKTASPADINEMHNFIRDLLREHYKDGHAIRILYGGSVKPDNAEEILSIENVNGALVGGASLDAKSFIAIAKAA